MKKNIGIWIDTKQAILINLLSNSHSIKKIESNIELREREPGESKKFGRFGNNYTTYDKNKLNRKNEQTNHFVKNLLKEIENCESVVLFGPSNMKNVFAKEIKANLRYSSKLLGVANSDLITENQMVAWVKKFFDDHHQNN